MKQPHRFLNPTEYEIKIHKIIGLENSTIIALAVTAFTMTSVPFAAMSAFTIINTENIPSLFYSIEK